MWVSAKCANFKLSSFYFTNQSQSVWKYWYFLTILKKAYYTIRLDGCSKLLYLLNISKVSHANARFNPYEITNTKQFWDPITIHHHMLIQIVGGCQGKNETYLL